MLSRSLGLTFRPTSRCVSCWFGLGAGLLGGLALLGRALGVDALSSLGPGTEMMHALTASLVLMLGVALALPPDPDGLPRSPATIAGAVAAGGGLVVLALRTLEVPLADGVARISAACIVVTGVGVVLHRTGRPGLAHLSGVATALVGWLLLSAHLLGFAPSVTGQASSPVAFQTSLAIDLLGIALIWATPDFGILGMARRGDVAALLARIAIPVLVAFPLGVGWADLYGMRQGWYSADFALAMMAIAAGTVGGIVLWFTLRAIVGLDDARSDALAELAAVNARLEHEVADRTASLEAQIAIQRASLEALEQGVTLSSMEGEVLLLNRAAREMLGYDSAELSEVYRSGRTTTYHRDGSLLPANERPVARTTLTGEPVSGEVVTIVDVDGRALTIRVSTQPIRDAHGELAGVVTAFSEISAELEAQRVADDHLAAVTELNAQLEQAVKMKDRFLSMVTHDMRSPIATIIGLGELLSRPDFPVPDDKRAGHLQSIMRQGQRLELLVQDLLSASVIDGGAISFDPHAVHLTSVVRQVSVDARLADEVEVRVPDDLLVFADPLRLAQILSNLILNATTHGRAPVTVTAVREGIDVVIRVADGGGGVAPEFAPRLFDRFTTASSGRSGKAGPGLGLAIVKGLVELHGGDVWHEPASQGGACFAVRLPSGVAADALAMDEMSSSV